jgi:hypothetical protein
MIKYYDTCSLLNQGASCFKAPFIISEFTLKELEEIKTSAHKDNQIKYQARHILNLLLEKEGWYTVIPFIWESFLSNYLILHDNIDSRIILTAVKWAENLDEDLIFITDDLSCYHIAKQFTQ